MCGRFTLHTSVHEIVERFSLPKFDFSYTPSFNVAPTQDVFTVISTKNGPSAALMRWGLIPPWLQKGPSRPPLINARLETLTEKPTFSRLVDERRCLIIADGFYEWKKEGARKYPVYITLQDGAPFAFAGLWDQTTALSCTIITQEANEIIKPIHHRMPVILTPDTEKLWLSDLPFSEMRGLLADQEQQLLRYHRVSTLVNSPRNNEAACIQPVD